MPGHSRIVRSSLAEAKVFPSGLQATSSQDSIWPCSARSGCPLAASHSRIVWSQLAEARVFPSGLQATLYKMSCGPGECAVAARWPRPTGGSGFVRTRRGQGLAIRAPGHAVHSTYGLGECAAVARWPHPTAGSSGHRSPKRGSCHPGSTPRSSRLYRVAAGCAAVARWPLPTAGSCLSQLADARVLPSGLQATLNTTPVWPWQRAQRLPAGRIPQPDRFVVTRGGQGLAVRAPGNAVHTAAVALRVRSGLPAGRIPQPDVLSALAEARVLPSGLQATLVTAV